MDNKDASSGSGFSSEDTNISSDDDSVTEDWKMRRSMTVPMADLQSEFYLPGRKYPRDVDVKYIISTYVKSAKNLQLGLK